MGVSRFMRILLVAAALIAPFSKFASADSITSALEAVYLGNPRLNAKRMSVRAAREEICQAEAGLRPNVGIVATVAREYYSLLSLYTGNYFGTPYSVQSIYKAPDWSETVSLNAAQLLFDGSQTAHTIDVAKYFLTSTQAMLRSLEQQLLLATATAYMDYLRASADLVVKRDNVTWHRALVRQLRDKMGIKDTNQTDVAQAEATLAAAEGEVSKAEMKALEASAEYRRLVGREPLSITPAEVIDRRLPPSLKAAIELGLRQSPDIEAALLNARISHTRVRIVEGALLPVATLQVSLQQSHFDSPIITQEARSASATVQVTAPIFQGGTEYAEIRRRKEIYSRDLFTTLDIRDKAIATITDAWDQFAIAKSEIDSSVEQVNAERVALDGVRAEIRLKFRTIAELLHAGQRLLDARLQLLTAQHDRIVASYSLMSATGTLTASTLGLNVPIWKVTSTCDHPFDH